MELYIGGENESYQELPLEKNILASGEWMNNHIGYGGVWKYYIIVNDICQRRKMHISEYVKF